MISFKSIHSKIVVLVSILIVFSISVYLVTTLFYFAKTQKSSAVKSFSEAEKIVKTLLASKRSRLLSEARMVGILPILRATVGTGDIETINQSAEGYKEDLNLPIFEVFDDAGNLMIRQNGENSHLANPLTKGLVSAVLEHGDSINTFALRGGQPVLLVSAPIGPASEPVGALIIGEYFDSYFVKKVNELSNADISFLVNKKVMNTSLDERGLRLLRSQINTKWSSVNRDIAQKNKNSVLIDNGESLFQVISLFDFKQQVVGQMVLQMSLINMKQEQRQFIYRVVAVGVAMLLFSFAFCFLLAKSLSGPLGRLKNVAEEIILSNDITKRVKITGQDEIAVFEKTFNHLLDEIEDQQKELEQTYENSRILLQIVTHDIANHLFIVILRSDLAESILKKDKFIKATESIAMVNQAAKNISDLIENVRKMQAVEQGKLVLEMQPVDLNQIIQEIYFTFAHKFDEKQIVFESDVINKDISVLAEPVSLKNNVINNIISNAIKFTSENGRISLNVAEENGKIHISIKDTGIGIPLEILDNVFTINKKTNRPGTKGEQGTGFGLPLVKLFMDKYNGDIEIFSTSISDNPAAHGTTVNLYLKKAA